MRLIVKKGQIISDGNGNDFRIEGFTIEPGEGTVVHLSTHGIGVQRKRSEPYGIVKTWLGKAEVKATRKKSKRRTSTKHCRRSGMGVYTLKFRRGNKKRTTKVRAKDMLAATLYACTVNPRGYRIVGICMRMSRNKRNKIVTLPAKHHPAWTPDFLRPVKA